MPRIRDIVKAGVVHTPLAPSWRFRRAVRETPGPDLVYLGTAYGGWSVPDSLLHPSSICYCGGVGYDISFDRALIDRYGSAVYAFDPTPSATEFVERTASGLERFKYYPWGLWSKDGSLRFYEPDYSDTNFSAVNLHGTTGFFDASCRSLESIMSELGHDRIDLLKLDIEGAEYEVLRSVTAGSLRPTVLCVELHKPRGHRGVRRMIETVGQLERCGYALVSRRGYDLTFVRRE